MFMHQCGKALLTTFFVFQLFVLTWAQAQTLSPSLGFQNEKLEYHAAANGDRIPDFSFCGYQQNSTSIPDVPAQLRIAPSLGDQDDTIRLQAAIDALAALPLGDDGFRGALLLEPGEFRVHGRLRITASGIVLRGSGAGGVKNGGTAIRAIGWDREPAIRILGGSLVRADEAAIEVKDEYVPLGASSIRLSKNHGLQAGDRIWIRRPSTDEWLQVIGAKSEWLGWRAGSRDVLWERTVTEVDEQTIYFDAPLTCALDANYGGGTIERWNTDRRIQNVGIEDVQLISDYDQQNLKDEQHAWHGIITNDVKNAWIRRVSFQHFVGGAVLVDLGSINVTVQDCASLQPVGEMGGYRRHSFFTQGQQTLFLRCWAEQGRHDFSVGQCSAGPNAFVHCFAKDAIGDSGPLESWGNGVLYDNVRIDGHDLKLTNRWNDPPKAGWTAANCVLWQCQASQIQCDSPPTAYNWAVGFWATPAGNGVMSKRSDFVNPLSLYHQQLAERTDRENAKQIEPFLLNPVGATNPTLSEAADFVANSNSPAATLLDLIRQNWNRQLLPLDVDVPLFEQKSPPSSSKKNPVKRMEIHNGWIVVDGKLKTGDHLTPTWWRGSIQPDSAVAFGPSISRYAPGRMGTGLTDDLDTVVNGMQQRNVASYNHHYGLWYDRRRDDHLMVRRATAEVAPPFFEQPFARTGQGTASDGLSLYDLTKWNTWYWQRLSHFADRCDQQGLILFHENYFQHNILEAGAHWADSPWRPANNVNQTPFPEPPPYVGDKRIFLAHQFYDISQPILRELHRNYIRQCLSSFAENQNVIQLISAEFSGPLEFVEFWIDTIVQWEQETGRNVTLGLSCPKNVQDAILDDPKRREAVDIIDIRYWTYMENNELFAPEGGHNLAPRQHVRQLRPKATSFGSIVRSVREYRTRFPQTPVTYYADMYCRSDRNGWAVLMGGGSLPNLMPLADDLSSEIIQMQPDTSLSLGEGQYALSNDTKSYLVYSNERPNSIELTLPAMRRYEFSLVNQATGQLQQPFRLVTGNRITLPTETAVVFVRAIEPRLR